MNILLTSVGRRNYLVRYFKQALRPHGRVVVADMQPTAPAFVDADEAHVVPGVYAQDYVESILELCRKSQITAIISLNDLELPILAEVRSQFEACGIKLILSSEQVIDLCFDKYATSQYLQSLGMRSPATFSSWEDFLVAFEAKHIAFPVVVKPRWGTASVCLDFAQDMEELRLCYALAGRRLRNTMLARVSARDYSRANLIQQRILGREYGVDIINDLDGNFVTCVVKEKLAMRAGETDKAKVVSSPEIEAIAQRIGQNLRHVGNLDCDILVDDQGPAVLELNPRFGGGFPFSYMAGADLPLAIVRWLEKKPADGCFRVQHGGIYAKYDNLADVGRPNSG
jgi:carbamoyl-phosphate synthase large subunit